MALLTPRIFPVSAACRKRHRTSICG